MIYWSLPHFMDSWMLSFIFQYPHWKYYLTQYRANPSLEKHLPKSFRLHVWGSRFNLRRVTTATRVDLYIYVWLYSARYLHRFVYGILIPTIFPSYRGNSITIYVTHCFLHYTFQWRGYQFSLQSPWLWGKTLAVDTYEARWLWYPVDPVIATS